MSDAVTDNAIDIDAIRARFPILARRINDKPLVYLDNANTSQKPRDVIDAVDAHYRLHNANVARTVHTLGAESTQAYEDARSKLARFVNAAHRDEVVLTSGTTQAINLVAFSHLLPTLRAGDVIVTTLMEHHANIVPWQIVAERCGARVVAAPIDARGELLVDEYVRLLDAGNVRIACVTHVSNVLGTINPVAAIARETRRRGIPLLVDGSQAAPHMAVDVQALGCDFYAITGHKMFAPTGTGALWARRELLAAMPPFLGGGEMIRTVSFAGSTFADPPQRFEAGTPNIAGFAGINAAIDFIGEIGIARIAAREQALLAHATDRLRAIPGLRIFGEAADKAAVISFAIDGVHAHDLATMLDVDGIAVRSGQHCAHPLIDFFGVSATLRASLAFWNTEAEIDCFADAVDRLRRRLS